MEHRWKSLDSKTLVTRLPYKRFYFSTKFFKIQVHNLLFEYFFAKNGKFLNSKIGKLLGVDLLPNWTIKLGKYMWMKVEIEVNLPLKGLWGLLKKCVQFIFVLCLCFLEISLCFLGHKFKGVSCISRTSKNEDKWMF